MFSSDCGNEGIAPLSKESAVRITFLTERRKREDSFLAGEYGE